LFLEIVISQSIEISRNFIKGNGMDIILDTVKHCPIPNKLIIETFVYFGFFKQI